MNQHCKHQCACPEVCMLNHIKNLGIHVTPEDKQRWNTAAEKSSGKDIDIDEYSTTEEVKQLIKDYVDNQGFITDIPEYYETEEEVLLLLNTTLGNYTRSEDLDETLAQYTTLAVLNEFEQSVYEYLELFKQDVLEDTKYVTAMLFSLVSRDLTLTQSDGTTLSVNIPGGGGGSSVSAYLMMEAIAYCNVSSDVTPATPEGGSYNFNTYILTPPHDPTIGSTVVWANSQNGMIVDSTHSIYISKRVFSSDPDAPSTSWSQPILYSGSIQTETTNVNVYSTEVAKVFTVYCEGTILKITDPVSGEISYRSVPPSNVSHAPEGGTYDRANDTLSSNPHTYGVPNEFWTLNRPTIPSTWTDPDTELSEDPVTFSKACYFSIGTVKSDNSLEWSAPSVYGIDYVIQASNLRFIAIDYSVLAEHISLSTNELAIVAENVDLKTEQLAIIAQYVSIDAPFTKFRGSVSATEFAVVKDNAYYTGTPGNVTKNTDIDQTLFSISQNTNLGYDPTSPATDVVLNIWNPGQLVDHITGTLESGGGSKGELNGNEIEYTVNPKKLAQSVTGTYSWAYNYIIDSQSSDFDMRSSFCTTRKRNTDSTITLPDPKTYVGCTINGSFETVVYPHRLEYGTFSGHESRNNDVAIGPFARSIMLTGVWHKEGSVLINFNTAHPLWECVEEIGNILTDYSNPELHTVNDANPYNNLTKVPTLSVIMSGEVPRITITDHSGYQFVRLNVINDSDALLLGLYERTNSVVSLNTNFYKDLYYAYDRVFRQSNIYQPLLLYVFEDNVPVSNEHYNYDSIKKLYEFGDESDPKPTNIYIVPSVIGLKKILESKPLSFIATAKMVNTDRLTQTTTYAEKSCKFYYWDIVTTDFTIVAVYDNEVSIPRHDDAAPHYPFKDITTEQSINVSNVLLSNCAWDYIISSPTKFASLLVEAEDSCASIKNDIPTLWALVENGVTAYTQ